MEQLALVAARRTTCVILIRTSFENQPGAAETCILGYFFFKMHGSISHGLTTPTVGAFFFFRSPAFVPHFLPRHWYSGHVLVSVGAQALYRLGRHGEAAEIYGSIAEEEEASGAGGGFPPVSVNLAAAYAAAGHGEKALDDFPPEDVSTGLTGQHGWCGVGKSLPVNSCVCATFAVAPRSPRRPPRRAAPHRTLVLARSQSLV